MLCLTRRYHFPAAHRLWNPSLSAQENEAHFGPCTRLHGHNYTLAVTLSGTPHPTTGMIINIPQLDQLVQETLLQFVDHRHLDDDVAFLQGILSTVENVAQVFYNRLEPALPSHVSLYRVRLYESENNWTDITHTAEVPLCL